MIRTLKSIIRRYLVRQPALHWSDIIPYALVAMRMTPAASHGLPPCTIIMGGGSVLPSQLPGGLDDVPGEDATPWQEAAYFDAMVHRTEHIRKHTAARLTRRDK